MTAAVFDHAMSLSEVESVGPGRLKRRPPSEFQQRTSHHPLLRPPLIVQQLPLSSHIINQDAILYLRRMPLHCPRRSERSSHGGTL
jgi:hypothetical protein